MCVCVSDMSSDASAHAALCERANHRTRTRFCMLRSVWTVREHFTLLLVLCCDSDSGECMGHVHIPTHVDIPTSMSVKWESDPECPSSDCVYQL